jgi:hypothetical protein
LRSLLIKLNQYLQIMPFRFEVANADALARTVGSMIGRITYMGGVEMPKELSDWQVQDMHRKRPATKRSRWRRGSTNAQTLVRAHSRLETEKSTRYQRRLLRRLRRATGRRVISDFIQLRRSTRPVLRESLVEQLQNRMVRALRETISWGS